MTAAIAGQRALPCRRPAEQRGRAGEKQATALDRCVYIYAAGRLVHDHGSERAAFGAAVWMVPANENDRDARAGRPLNRARASCVNQIRDLARCRRPTISPYCSARGGFSRSSWSPPRRWQPRARCSRREGYSLFGTLLLAGLAAVGGEVLRDLLVGRHPPAALARPDYLLTVIATVGACYATVRIHRMALARPGSPGRLRRLCLALARWMPSEEIVLVCDAAGLGAFTLVGVWVAFAYGCRPLWLWGPLLATMTTVGGGILRDIVRADHASAMLKTTLYAEISAIGGLAMTLCIQALGGPQHQWLLILLIGLFVLATATARVMAHFHRIPAPLFEPLASAPAAVSGAAGSPRGLSNAPGARRHRLWPGEGDQVARKRDSEPMMWLPAEHSIDPLRYC